MSHGRHERGVQLHGADIGYIRARIEFDFEKPRAGTWQCAPHVIVKTKVKLGGRVMKNVLQNDFSVVTSRVTHARSGQLRVLYTALLRPCKAMALRLC